MMQNHAKCKIMQKHLTSDAKSFKSSAKTCKNNCFCIFLYQRCVLLQDLYQNNRCFCIKTGCFCIIQVHKRCFCIILHFYAKKEEVRQSKTMCFCMILHCFCMILHDIWIKEGAFARFSIKKGMIFQWL